MRRFFISLVLVLFVGCVRMEPFPLPLSEEIQEYIIEQAFSVCPGGEILVSFLEKEGRHFILFASPLKDKYSRWVVIEMKTAGGGNEWEGRATVENGKPQAVVTSGKILPKDFNPCRALGMDGPEKTSL